MGVDYPNTEATILVKGSLGIGKTSLSVFAKTGLAYYINTQKSNSNDFRLPLVFDIDFLLTPHLTLEVTYKVNYLLVRAAHGNR